MPSYRDEEIRSALRDLQQSRPAYGELLDFYQDLFLAQNRVASASESQALGLDRDQAHQQLAAGFALFSPDTFPLDPDALKAFLGIVCDVSKTAPDPLADCARHVLAALSRDSLEMAALGDALLVDDEAELARMAAELEVDAGALRFLTAIALAPLATRLANTSAAALLIDAPFWERGRCPICGHLPTLSTLADQGARFLICGFCQHQWAAPRIFCPACETRDKGSQAYFFSQEEVEYRVYTCDTCRFYLKTVDLRLLTRPFFPPAEVLLTLHLDLQAQEQGFRADAEEAAAAADVGTTASVFVGG